MRWDEPPKEYPFTKQDELEKLIEYLILQGRPVTLASATIALAELTRRAPGVWSLTLADLVEMWPVAEVA